MWIDEPTKKLYSFGGNCNGLSNDLYSVSIATVAETNYTALTFVDTALAFRPPAARTSYVLSDGSLHYMFGGYGDSAQNSSLYVFNAATYACLLVSHAAVGA